MADSNNAAQSAFSKLDRWFAELAPDEQVVIADVIRMAAAFAADEAAESDEVSGYGMPLLFGGLSTATAPNIAGGFPVLAGMFSGGCGENRAALGQPLSSRPA